MRNLYERGFGPKDVRELFRLIDWLMALPPALQDMFSQDLAKIQEKNRMPKTVGQNLERSQLFSSGLDRE